MSTQQHGGPKDDQRDTQRRDVGGDTPAQDERHPREKTPGPGGQHPPGMGEDEDESYVPEKQRP